MASIIESIIAEIHGRSQTTVQNGDEFINHHLIVFGQSQNTMGASQGNPEYPKCKATSGNLVVSFDSNCHNVSALFPFYSVNWGFLLLQVRQLIMV